MLPKINITKKILNNQNTKKEFMKYFKSILKIINKFIKIVNLTKEIQNINKYLIMVIKNI